MAPRTMRRTVTIDQGGQPPRLLRCPFCAYQGKPRGLAMHVSKMHNLKRVGVELESRTNYLTKKAEKTVERPDGTRVKTTQTRALIPQQVADMSGTTTAANAVGDGDTSNSAIGEPSTTQNTQTREVSEIADTGGGGASEQSEASLGTACSNQIAQYGFRIFEGQITLQYSRLADQMESLLHPSLTSPSHSIRAIDPSWEDDTYFTDDEDNSLVAGHLDAKTFLPEDPTWTCSPEAWMENMDPSGFDWRTERPNNAQGILSGSGMGHDDCPRQFINPADLHQPSRSCNYDYDWDSLLTIHDTPAQIPKQTAQDKMGLDTTRNDLISSARSLQSPRGRQIEDISIALTSISEGVNPENWTQEFTDYHYYIAGVASASSEVATQRKDEKAAQAPNTPGVNIISTSDSAFNAPAFESPSKAIVGKMVTQSAAAQLDNSANLASQKSSEALVNPMSRKRRSRKPKKPVPGSIVVTPSWDSETMAATPQPTQTARPSEAPISARPAAPIGADSTATKTPTNTRSLFPAGWALKYASPTLPVPGWGVMGMKTRVAKATGCYPGLPKNREDSELPVGNTIIVRPCWAEESQVRYEDERNPAAKKNKTRHNTTLEISNFVSKEITPTASLQMNTGENTTARTTKTISTWNTPSPVSLPQQKSGSDIAKSLLQQEKMEISFFTLNSSTAGTLEQSTAHTTGNFLSGVVIGEVSSRNPGASKRSPSPEIVSLNKKIKSCKRVSVKSTPSEPLKMVKSDSGAVSRRRNRLEGERFTVHDNGEGEGKSTKWNLGRSKRGQSIMQKQRENFNEQGITSTQYAPSNLNGSAAISLKDLDLIQHPKPTSSHERKITFNEISLTSVTDLSSVTQAAIETGFSPGFDTASQDDKMDWDFDSTVYLPKILVEAHVTTSSQPQSGISNRSTSIARKYTQVPSHSREPTEDGNKLQIRGRHENLAAKKQTRGKAKETLKLPQGVQIAGYSATLRPPEKALDGGNDLTATAILADKGLEIATNDQVAEKVKPLDVGVREGVPSFTASKGAIPIEKLVTEDTGSNSTSLEPRSKQQEVSPSTYEKGKQAFHSRNSEAEHARRKFCCIVTKEKDIPLPPLRASNNREGKAAHSTTTVRSCVTASLYAQHGHHAERDGGEPMDIGYGERGSDTQVMDLRYILSSPVLQPVTGEKVTPNMEGMDRTPRPQMAVNCKPSHALGTRASEIQELELTIASSEQQHKPITLQRPSVPSVQSLPSADSPPFAMANNSPSGSSSHALKDKNAMGLKPVPFPLFAPTTSALPTQVSTGLSSTFTPMNLSSSLTSTSARPSRLTSTKKTQINAPTPPPPPLSLPIAAYAPNTSSTLTPINDPVLQTRQPLILTLLPHISPHIFPTPRASSSAKNLLEQWYNMFPDGRLPEHLAKDPNLVAMKKDVAETSQIIGQWLQEFREQDGGGSMWERLMRDLVMLKMGKGKENMEEEMEKTKLKEEKKQEGRESKHTGSGEGDESDSGEVSEEGEIVG